MDRSDLGGAARLLQATQNDEAFAMTMLVETVGAFAMTVVCFSRTVTDVSVE
ncbi:MAG: hypothetical protein JJE39_05055 [Vicinamibacteria bacterium]|nr:hypothetical protein [Vicinamibacteria bacterium]